MTVSFADPFDIPQFSKKYSVILKGRQCPCRCSATCKWLCIRHLTEIRVMVFTTLKMPKALIVSEIRAARPGGSCQTALCLMKLQNFRTVIFYPDLSRNKNFSIFASSETICDFNGKDG